MNNIVNTISKCEEQIAHNALERQKLHDVTTLAAEIKHLLVRDSSILKEEGIRKEMRQLEEWLEAGRKGPAPAGIISESGILWLIGLRDKLKLSAEETQRLEGEGGPPASKEQMKRNEDLLNVVRHIDKIISDNSTSTTH